MTQAEVAQLMKLRSAIELATLKRLSTSQVLREAIRQAHARRNTAPLSVARPVEARGERFDLIVDEQIRGFIEDLQCMYEGTSINDVVVAAALAAYKENQNARPKRVAPRPF